MNEFDKGIVIHAKNGFNENSCAIAISMQYDIGMIAARNHFLDIMEKAK